MSSMIQHADPVGNDVVWADPDRTATAADAAAAEAGLSGADLAKRWGVTMRALRFYESRGLIAPRRLGRARSYSQRDSERIGVILRAKKLGFTLAEIGQMIDAKDGAAAAGGLNLTAQKCLQQIGHLETQMKDIIEALADLRRIHLDLCCKTGDAARE